MHIKETMKYKPTMNPNKNAYLSEFNFLEILKGIIITKNKVAQNVSLFHRGFPSIVSIKLPSLNIALIIKGISCLNENKIRCTKS